MCEWLSKIFLVKTCIWRECARWPTEVIAGDHRTVHDSASTPGTHPLPGCFALPVSRGHHNVAPEADDVVPAQAVQVFVQLLVSEAAIREQRNCNGWIDPRVQLLDQLRFIAFLVTLELGLAVRFAGQWRGPPMASDQVRSRTLPKSPVPCSVRDWSY